MKVITIACLKGGVGKTSLALNLGKGLEAKNYKVLYVDLDIQASLTKSLGINIDNIKNSAYDLLKGKASAKDCIINNCITSSLELGTFTAENSGVVGKEYKLKETIEPLKDQYDFCIIDTSPSIDLLISSALTASDYLLMSTEASLFGIDGVNASLSKSYDPIKKYCNKDLKLGGIVINRYNKISILQNQCKKVLEENAKQYNTFVYSTKVRQCQAIAEAQATRKSIYEYAPKSNGAKDYEAIVKEFLEKNK